MFTRMDEKIDKILKIYTIVGMVVYVVVFAQTILELV